MLEFVIEQLEEDLRNGVKHEAVKKSTVRVFQNVLEDAVKDLGHMEDVTRRDEREQEAPDV